MNIEKFSISSDPAFYEAWPDVTMASDGTLVCVFSECSAHCFRPYTRIMLTDSKDNGCTWSPKRPLTEGTEGLPFFYNCPRISTLPDGKLAVIVDRIPSCGENRADKAENFLYLSEDNGRTWHDPLPLPLRGIVPDKYRYLNNNRIATAAHHSVDGTLTQFLRYSDDGGKSWSQPVTVAHDPRYNFCEVCLIPLGDNTVAALLRENSGMGYDCFKTVSTDNGESWSEAIPFPLPGCHRPVAGFLKDGRVLITYRFLQGGSCGKGKCSQNFFGALTDKDSLLATERNAASTRIFPIDYDRAPKADTGYSGWVQLPDDSVYVVNYIVDDAVTQAQIRGYRLHPEELMFDVPPKRCSVCNCPKEICKRYNDRP